ncbi:MAG: 3-deoxy-D-manno-octulosonic acid transferase [candidate division Zixibacteria bacterium]|nr:3-deoxy-D-manno-octulosonic acid transferase [candidate division Zixibacteria bacterium]
MTYFIYNILFTLIWLLRLPYLLIRGLWGKHGVIERLGFLPKTWRETFKKNQVIWIHAASVGEVKMLPAIIPRLKDKFPQTIIAVSVMTRTGKKEAQKSLKDVQFIFHPPLDLLWSTRKAARAINPSLFILTETELWPNLIREVKKRDSKIALINGRMSNKSFPNYRRFKFFFSKVLSFVDAFCMRSQLDAKRIISLGAPAHKVNVVGNIKFDSIFFQEENSDGKQVDAFSPMASRKKIIVAGSTHPTEEEMILRTFKKLVSTHSDLILIIAPRHLNHLNELEKELAQFGLNFIKRSELKQNPDPQCEVIILDTLGELNQFYGLAKIAFVGGSLVPKGGHNLLEPARFSVPVLFGPYVDNFQEMAALLKTSGGGIQVKDETELYLKMDELIIDESKRKILGQKAKEAISQQGSAAERTAQILSRVW